MALRRWMCLKSNWSPPFLSDPSRIATRQITPRYWSYHESKRRAFNGASESPWGLKIRTIISWQPIRLKWWTTIKGQSFLKIKQKCLYQKNVLYLLSLKVTNISFLRTIQSIHNVLKALRESRTWLDFTIYGDQFGEYVFWYWGFLVKQRPNLTKCCLNSMTWKLSINKCLWL